MLGAFFCFAAMDTSAKWLVTAAIPAVQVAFLRYCGHFFWVLLLYVPREGMGVAKSNTPRLQLLRGFLLLVSTTLNFTALYYLPLTVTIALFFATPMLVCLLSIPILGERVGIKRFAAVFVGFAGVLVIVQPWGESFDWHVLYSIGAFTTASGYFVLSRRIAGADANSVSQFYTSGLAVMVLCPFALSIWAWPATAVDWIVLGVLGSLGMLGHSLLVRAYHYAEASVLAPVIYSQIVYITFFSWLLFDEPPDARTTIGTLIIVGSGLYIWLRERQATQASQKAEPA